LLILTHGRQHIASAVGGKAEELGSFAHLREQGRRNVVSSIIFSRLELHEILSTILLFGQIFLFYKFYFVEEVLKFEINRQHYCQVLAQFP
jgi:hypothetical protein